MKSIEALIPEYALGTLPDDERREVEALAASSPALEREIAEVTEALAQAGQDLTPVAPPPSLRARLLATVRGVDRFAPFLDDLVRLFELPVETIRAHLARIDAPRDQRPPPAVKATGWERTLLGVALDRAELFHFQAGPRLAAAGAAGGVLRVEAGASFPQHRHHGDEVTYVLEGGYIAGGRVYGPGAEVEMAEGTAHDYRAAPERDLVIIVLHRGITMLPAS